VGSIDRLGEREIRTTTAIAARFQDQPIHTLERILTDRQPLARNQHDLRQLVRRLSELAGGASLNTADLTGEIVRVEQQIRRLVAAIDHEREILDVDNGVLNQQERALWAEILAIREYVTLAARIDDLLEARIDGLAQDDPGHARILRDDVLYAVRSRRRDLLLQLAIASQGYAALRRIEQGNLDLIWLIRGATTTTVTALRTALLAARAAPARGTGMASRTAELTDAWREVIDALDRLDVRRRETLDAVHRGS
jgi:uncharacterized coiled-coil protein SlyX